MIRLGFQEDRSYWGWGAVGLWGVGWLWCHIGGLWSIARSRGKTKTKRRSRGKCRSRSKGLRRGVTRFEFEGWC